MTYIKIYMPLYMPRRTTLKDNTATTIVFDNTFVGQGLELQNKIVRGNRIIDCVTGAWVDVEDAGVARWISDTSFGWLGQIWHFLAGTSRGRRD